MKKQAIIRQATSADAQSILALIKELAVFEREPDAVVLKTDDLVRDGFGEHPSFMCFVAEEDQQIVGLALGYPRYSTWKGKTMHAEDLIVQKITEEGIGFALYKRFIHYAHSLQVRRVEWAVLDWNQSAIDFYEQTGAEYCLIGAQLKWMNMQFLHL